MKTTLALDRGGVIISSLCLIHCLFFPLLSTFLPLFGAWSDIEWIHKLLVIMALPLSMTLIVRPETTLRRLLAILGIFLLIAGAFVESLHKFEVTITVIGAIFLGLAHFRTLQTSRHNH